MSNVDDDTASRIDPGTNRVTATYEAGREPEGIAVDGDAVWVEMQRDGQVWKFDAGTGTVLKGRGGLQPRFVTVAAGSVWVSAYVSDTVVRIDPMIGSGSAVWVASTDDRVVSHIDTDTNRVVATVAIPGGPDGVTVDDAGFVWVATDEGRNLVEIDPRTSAVTRTITLDRVDPAA